MGENIGTTATANLAALGANAQARRAALAHLVFKLIVDFQVDGVVDLVLQACHTYNVETSMVRRLVKDEMGIPLHRGGNRLLPGGYRPVKYQDGGVY